MGIIERVSPFRLISSHSDYEGWEQSNNSAIERGKFINTILEQYLKCEGLTILILGPDNGNIHKVLSAGNKIVSFDSSFLRLNKQADNGSNGLIDGEFLFPPFKNKSFNLIIIQNVIEQIKNMEKFLENISCILKDKGIIYLSTPNKFSIINIISDPYSGLPFAALSTHSRKGKNLSQYFIRLFSLNRLKNYFRGFEFHLNTIQSVQILFNNKEIINTSSHPAWIKFIKKTGLNKILLKIVNNKMGFINSYLTPSFYLILKKHF